MDYTKLIDEYNRFLDGNGLQTTGQKSEITDKINKIQWPSLKSFNTSPFALMDTPEIYDH